MAERRINYLEGSPLSHISKLVLFVAVSMLMTFTANLLNLVYATHLNIEAVRAAWSYVGSFTMGAYAFGIAPSIAVGILFSQALGKKDRKRMAVISSVGFGYVVLFSIVPVVFLPFLPGILHLAGATADQTYYAHAYLQISIPFNVALGVIFFTQAILRSLGYIRETLIVTLFSSIPIILLGPLFAFGLKMGVEGLAWGVSVSYALSALVGVFLTLKRRIFGLFSSRDIRSVTGPALMLSIPSLLNTFLSVLPPLLGVWSLGKFDQSARSAMSVISTLIPWVFVGMIALNAALTPILAQSFSALGRARAKEVLKAALKFVVLYFPPSAILFVLLLHHADQLGFSLSPQGAIYVKEFSWVFAFMGLILGLNVLPTCFFNVTGRAHYSTFINLFSLAGFCYPLSSLVFHYAQTPILGPLASLAGMLLGALLQNGMFLWLFLRGGEALERRNA